MLAYAWLEWCKLADKGASWQYRIEKLDTVYPELFERLKLPIPERLPDVPKDVNTRRHFAGWR
ncbi:unnamed protein product, partial [marine sediment metagenome]